MYIQHTFQNNIFINNGSFFPNVLNQGFGNFNHFGLFGVFGNIQPPIFPMIPPMFPMQNSTYPMQPPLACNFMPQNIFFTMPMETQLFSPMVNWFNNSIKNIAEIFKPKKNTTKPVKTNYKLYSQPSQNNSSELKITGYDAEKGKKIAREMSRRIDNHLLAPGTQCGKAVGDTLNELKYLKTTSGRDGHLFDDILAAEHNEHYKQISTVGLDLTKLPAGCLLVYEKGVDNYSAEYGHVEISDGNGHGLSFCRTNIRPNAKVFIPVKTNNA